MKYYFLKRLEKSIPGGAHTYSKGSDQVSKNFPVILKKGLGAYVFDNIDYNNLVNQNFSLYKNYLNKFVKSSKSKNKYIWDIVGSKLNNL
jgi:hypothetical protein